MLLNSWAARCDALLLRMVTSFAEELDGLSLLPIQLGNATFQVVNNGRDQVRLSKIGGAKQM